MYIRLSCCSLAVCFWCRSSLQPAPECDHGWCTCRQHCLGRYFDYAQWNILQHQKSSHASAQETRMVGDRRVQDSCGLHHTAHSTNTGLVGSKVVSEVVSANIAAKAAQMIQKHVFTRRSETLFLVISKDPAYYSSSTTCMHDGNTLLRFLHAAMHYYCYFIIRSHFFIQGNSTEIRVGNTRRVVHADRIVTQRTMFLLFP